jgi:O-antigen ligase
MINYMPTLLKLPRRAYISLWLNDERRLLLLRLVVIMAVLGLSYLLGQRPKFAIFIYLLAVAVPGALFLVRNPQVGLVGMVVSALVVPIAINTGTESRVNAPMMVILALSGLWLLDMIARQGQIQFIRSRSLLALVAMIVVAILAFIGGQLPWFREAQSASTAAQAGGLFLFIVSALVYAWVGHHLRDIKWLKVAVWAFIFLGTLYVMGRMFYPIRWLQTPFPPPVGAGSLFWVWLGSMTFSQLLINRNLHWRWRLLLAFSLGITLYVAFIQSYDWKSGWVPTFISIAVILGVWMPRFIVASVLIGLTPLVNFGGEVIESDLYSFETRFDAWVIMLEIIKVNPLFGLGPSNYYFYTPLFSIRGYYVSFNSHNQYFDVVAQIGLLGLFCLVWFFWEIGKINWSLLQRAPEGFAKAFVYGALGGLIGTIVAGLLGDWLIPFVYNVGFNGFRASIFAWLFLGALLAMDQMYPAEEQA